MMINDIICLLSDLSSSFKISPILFSSSKEYRPDP